MRTNIHVLPRAVSLSESYGTVWAKLWREDFDLALAEDY